MGRSSWKSTDWNTYATTTANTISSAKARGLSDYDARAQVFTSSGLKEYLDPKKVTIRESRDSEAHPNSTAIIIGLDVTGSMGIIAEKMATVELGKLVNGLLDRDIVSDPHIMMMGIGDINYDRVPLQASQFETDISIAEQLKDIYLEGGGGGNRYESYDLPWIFAASKTSIDCFEKRGKKGYLFTIGDELPPQRAVGKSQLFEATGCTAQGDTNCKDSLEAAQQKYSVFHIIVEQGDFCRRTSKEVNHQWTTLLGKRAISLIDYECLSEVIMSVISVNEGADPESVAASWEKPKVVDAVRHALGLSATKREATGTYSKSGSAW